MTADVQTDRIETDSVGADSQCHGIARTLRACGLAVVASLALVGIALASGLVPADLHRFVWIGAGAAAVTGCVGIALLGRCATVPAEPAARAAQLYLAGLAGALFLQVAAVVGGLVAFSVAGEKFPSLAAFGLTFAVTATVVQLLGSVSISRFLRARARANAGHVARAHPSGS
jgi:hypothetical protein